LFSFIGTLYLGRYLSAKDFGEMVFIFNLLTFLPSLTGLGLFDVLVRRKEATNSEISSVLNFILLTNIVAYFILVALVNSNFFQVEHKEVYYVTFLNLPLVTLQNYYGHLLFLQNSSMKLSSIHSIGGMISAIGALIMAYNGFGLWALVGQVIINSLVVLILLFFSCKVFPKFCFDWIFLKNCSHEAYKFLQNMVIKNLFVRSDRLILSFFFNKELVGLYDFASKFAFNLLLILQGNLLPLNRSYFFQIYHKGNSEEQISKELRTRTKSLFTTMFKFIMPAFIIIGFTAKEYLGIFYGDRWNGAEVFIMYLSLASIYRIFTDFYQVWLSFLGEVNLIKSSMLKSLGIMITTTPILFFYPSVYVVLILLILPLLLEHILFNKIFNRLTKQRFRWETVFYTLLIFVIFYVKSLSQMGYIQTSAWLLAILFGHFLFCHYIKKRDQDS
jgi:O-antigen/teichoic acid export membrane protein